MRRLRMFAVVMSTMAIAAVALPAQADDGDSASGLPFVSTESEESCRYAAAPTGPDQCDPTTRASAATGVVSAQTHLVSPAEGTAAWKAQSSARSYIVATHRLREPVPELNFEINVRVNRARIALSDSGLHPWAAFVLDEQLGRHGHIYVTARGSHSDCSAYCGGGTGLLVASNWDPGTTETISGEDIVVPLRVSRADGQDLPPGQVNVYAGVSTSVWQSHSWGDDLASVDAVVQQVAVR